MSEPGPRKDGFLSTIAPQPASVRREAALSCAAYALTTEDPESVLNGLLNALGLYETVGEP